jgi:single-stranded DNA-binding protein
MMVKGVKGAAGVKGLRTCVYGPLAELVYGHVRKGSRFGVIGHIQQRTTKQGKMVFEIVASEVDFLRNIEWETGKRVRDDLVQRGLLRPSHRDEDNGGGGVTDYADIYEELGSAIPEDLIDDERA